MNGNQQRSKSYHSDKQKKKECKSENNQTKINENLLSERVFFGIKTYIYVGYLRYFKLGGYNGTGIENISDLAKYIHEYGRLMRVQKGKLKPLEIGSILTELYMVEAIIKQEDTKNRKTFCDTFSNQFVMIS